MPWKEVKPMDEKVLFIADYLRKAGSFSQLCERYNVSRKTGYKWVGRYDGGGLEGLKELSRQPQSASLQTPYAIRQAILELRASRRDPPGPKKIQVLLGQRLDAQEIPSKTTIYNILRRAGQIEPRRRIRRVQAAQSKLHSPDEPNGLWSVDYKGQFKTGDGQWCYPLTVMDHASRYLLACQALPGTRLEQTRAVFERLFRQYGLPERIRSDNGVPFASVGVGGLSKLSIWWIRLGIVPERIEPGQPQQNGRHERMHRTLKREVCRNPAGNLRLQQRPFDVFRCYYNDQRPHESLEQAFPQSRYRPSPRAYPKRLPELQYPKYFHLHRVCQNGLVYWRGLRIYIGYLLRGEIIGLEQVGDGLWDVYFGPIRLGGFDERDATGRLGDYLTIKV